MSEKIYQLILHKGPRPGEIFSLALPSMILGRDPMSDIVLNDPEISRNHARLTMGEDGYSIQDMGSTNGTFVNGKRLRGEPFPLENGMSIILGSNVTLEYHAGEVEDDGNLLATVLSPAEALPRDEFDNAPESSTMMAHDPYAPTAMADDIEHDEDEEDEMPVEDMEAFDEMSSFDAPAPAASYEPIPAPYSPSPSPPPMSEMPSQMGEEEKGGSKTRTYIMIGVGVGLFLCCCLLGLVVIAAYYLESEGLLDTPSAAINSITAVVSLMQTAVL